MSYLEPQIKVCDYYSLDNDNITNMIANHGIRAYKLYLSIETKLSEKGKLVLNRNLSEELNVPYTILKSIVCDYGLFYMMYRDIFSFNTKKDIPEPFKDHVELISKRLELIPKISDELKLKSNLKAFIRDDYNSFLSYSVYTRYKNNLSNIDNEVKEYLLMKKEGIV